MRNLEIEEKRYLYINIDDDFYLEGMEYNNFWIEWYLCNNRYGVKTLLFGVDKEFNIKKYIKENYYDILELYYPYMDVEDIEGVENEE